MNYINILTIHKEPNYGALLQAFALYHIIEKLGGKPRIIDLGMQYRRRDFNLKNRLITTVYNWIKGYEYCYSIAEKFSVIHEPCRTVVFNSYQELVDANWEKDDVFLVGSDQVWNPDITGNLKRAYTLDFLPEECLNRYSYASSFGYIKDKEKVVNDLNIPKSFLAFKDIGVRESFGVDFLLCYGVKACEVIDPTMLIDDYHFLLRKSVIPNNNLLYLSLGEAPQMDVFVDGLSKKTARNVEKRFGYLQPERSVNKQWLYCEDWLHRIASCDIVVTDSFHATVFSIMFEKSFFVYTSNPLKVYRIANLLKKLGLEDRICTEVDDALRVKKIDYQDVKSKIKEYREASIEYLKNIVCRNESCNL